ncbi:DUF3109 family protein [Crocinitomicaceae bacterium]|jgi:hypothetical protein|nr:DUF3109 family protein [Crocinitomicaceae bacterium]
MGRFYYPNINENFVKKKQMLVEVHDKVVSTQIFERKFVCDLSACKGACCIEGDAGAPLTFEEVDILEETLDAITPYMRHEGIKAIEKQGVFYMDQDNEPVTTLVNEKECAFVYFDDNGITKCAVEQAHMDGKSDFKKPISCHLYPIRTKKFDDFTALNYDVWDICAPACDCGSKLNVPVFRFLKEAIIRAFGGSFFKELELVSKELEKEK